MSTAHGRNIAIPGVILAVMVLSGIYAWLNVVMTFNHPGVIGANYNAPGTDYMVFHGGIALARRGDWALLFDADRFTAFLNDRYHAVLSLPLTYRPWVYPPSFLIVMLPFAPFGFLASFFLFQAVTAACLAAALRAGRDRRRDAAALTIAVLLSPAATVTVLWGQGAFLTAAILIAGTRLLPTRPIIAGILFGILSIKPQHALLVPVMLLTVGAWTALLSAGLTSVGLAAASVLVFGLTPWRLWFVAARHFAGNVPLWDSSIHTCAVLLGAGPVLANVVMAAATGGAACVVVLAFRRPRPFGVQLAVLLACCNIAAPHSGPYDTLLLVVAAGLVLAESRVVHTTLAWTLALCIWLLPILGQPLISPAARFAPLLTILLLVWIFRQKGYETVRPVLP